MKAIILKDFGGTDNLILTDLAVPEIANDEVLVKLHAISINPVDIKTRNGKGVAGLLRDQMPIVLGWDISGTIETVGTQVTDFKPGDDVFGMLNFPQQGKAYAEYVVAKPGELAIKPAEITHDQAAASTLAALTAWQALNHHGKINKGDRVLIHAAAGGVGHFAVQMAKHLGTYVIGTASAANRDFLLSLGVDEHIDYKAQGFEEATENIDFVLDGIGGEYIDRSLKVTKPGGTVISIPSGLNETVTEKAKALGIHGYTIRVKPSAADMQTIAGFLREGIIKPHIFKTFAFEDMAAAHDQIESGRTVGKVTLSF